MANLRVILDTSPLITLCSFEVAGKLAIEHVLSVADVVVVETVAAEGTANPAYPDAAAIRMLLDAKRVAQLDIPATPFDAIIDAYDKLGQGERDTIRLGISMPDTQIVLDDYLAFVIAARFGLKPVLLLDLLVLLVKGHTLDKQVADEMVNKIAGRYSAPFVEHTRYKLRGLPE